MLICMQKINFISQFFLKILQRNSKVVILRNLAMPGHTHLKWQHYFEEIFNVYLQAKNELHSSHFPWDIAIYYKLFSLGTLGKACYTDLKYYHLVENFRIYLQAKKQFNPMFFWRYCIDMQTSYFRYFGHV